MKTVTVRKVVAKPASSPSKQTLAQMHVSSKTPIGIPTFIEIKDVQRLYFPLLSLKKIRKIVTQHVHTIKVGNKYLVNKKQIEDLLCNPNTKFL